MTDAFARADEEVQWDQAWAFLVDKLLNLLSPYGYLNLRALPASSKGKLLATCMAIDIVAEALSPPQIAKIFDKLADGPNDICDRIADDLTKAEFDALNCASRLECPPLAEGDAYVTVMEISSFMRKFVKPNTGEELSPDEIQRACRMFFEGDCDLSSLAKCELGKSNRLWVFPKSQFEQLRERMSRDAGKGAQILIDALGMSYRRGFGVGNLLHLVAIIHPAGRECGAKQPTAFDAHWRETHVQFISFGKEDGWGRTYSCTGSRYFESDDEGMPRERVHRDQSGLLGFTGKSLGYAGPLGNITQEMVLNAALKRFARAGRMQDKG